MSSSMDIALRRLTDQLKARAQAQASDAAASVAGEVADAATAEVDTHSAQRQFVHGVGPLYVAKTKNPDQYVDWTEIKNKPSFFPGAGGVDPETLELDGSQITTGTVSISRLPAAESGESNHGKLVRSDDPRLNGGSVVVAIAGEPLASGDYIRIVNSGGAARAFRADATAWERAAVGFVAASAGTDAEAEVYPNGENVQTYLEGATAADLGLTVFLSLTPGKISRTPPSGTGQLLQPLGTITAIHSSSRVSVLVRYEYRFRL